ncbi:HEAT repeat domain-containing protein [Desulfocicer vacuolatum]|nr:HEAT repeat domain-containing protein [Desulfocicer vacuolatum]
MLLVYTSNHEILAALKEIHGTKSAYLTIPAGNVVTGLGQLSTAFNGGLFFTFTLGTGLSVTAFLFGWVWHHLLGRNKKILPIAILCWVGGVAMVNYNGPQFIISATLLLTPFVVFFFTVFPHPSGCARLSRFYLWFHILLIFFSVTVAGFLGGNISFSNFRDTFLLSNPAGIMINDFYYRYTLHAARVFKPLGKRNVNTCFIDISKDDPLGKRIEEILLKADFFPVPPEKQVDLFVTKNGNHLCFIHRGKKILQCSTAAFVRSPSAWLKQFSLRTDNHLLFRQLIYFSLVAGLPLWGYIFLCVLLQTFLDKIGWSGNRTRMGVSVFVLSVIMVVVGILSYMSKISPHTAQNPVQSLVGRNRCAHLPTKSYNRHASHADEFLVAPHVCGRIAALKIICRKKIDLVDVQIHGALLKSSHVAERYWAARALAYSRGERGRKSLISLLEDSHPNVVCQALYALGKRADKTVVPAIIHLITTSDHWYVQWYGYRALKQLEWKQIALN